MENNDYKKFKEFVNKFFKKLRGLGIKFESNYDFITSDNPGIQLNFTTRGLRKFRCGIWPCGKWSDYYDIEKEDYISIFLIHVWNCDKFRPSSSDIEFIIKNEDDISTAIIELIDIKNHPIFHWYEISRGNHKFKNRTLEYLYTWFEIKKYEMEEKFKYDITPIILYWILKFISIFDHRVKKTKIFDEENTIPRYTFGFLATIECSENEKSWKRFCKLYSKIPQKIIKGAYFNVADYNEEMNEKEINIRMWKGVVYD